MKLIINGEEKIVEGNKSINQIMIDLKIIDKVMACAVNMDIVKKENWESYFPKENDKIELLQFVGGG
jgi:sulfur carrier protein